MNRYAASERGIALITVLLLLMLTSAILAGFLVTTWVSAKIYRTGILMYGKKATWKEMWKWAVRRA